MQQYLQTLQFNRGQITHRLAFALLLVVSLVSVLRAQSTGASLTGHITDPSKALIVDAKIAAINQSTNIIYEAATNVLGEYHLTNLPPSPYRIEIGPFSSR